MENVCPVFQNASAPSNLFALLAVIDDSYVFSSFIRIDFSISELSPLILNPEKKKKKP